MAYEFTGREVKSSTVKFNVVGDYVVGTLLGVKTNVKTQVGLANVWNLRAKVGSFHPSNLGEPQLVEESEDTSFFAKPGGLLDEKMKKIKNGQIFKVELTELKDSKFGEGHEQKLYSVQQGAMDPEYMGEGVAEEA